jgi:hypothetical protein
MVVSLEIVINVMLDAPKVAVTDGTDPVDQFGPVFQSLVAGLAFQLASWA